MRKKNFLAYMVRFIKIKLTTTNGNLFMLRKTYQGKNNFAYKLLPENIFITIRDGLVKLAYSEPLFQPQFHT